ncbi:MAG: hypothetical protein Q4E43_02605 [Akkermansia sp.]|nr:hypothetical protein [Akkermansia sp.]
MSKESILSSKMMAAIANVSPTDYTGQIAVMLSVLGDNLAECMQSQLSDAKAGQVYARPHQIAERWGYTDRSLRRFLHAAEQSGRVRTMTPTDIYGTKGKKMFHLGDLERFFSDQQP